MTKQEAIQALYRDAALSAAESLLRYPGAMGQIMALSIHSMACHQAYQIAATIFTPRGGKVIEVIEANVDV